MKKIAINPKILIWARETAHLKLEEIPASLISHQKLQDIEAGLEQPTLIQLQKLAKKYHRPLYTFFEEHIPQDDNYQVIPLFRKENKTNYQSSLALFLRDVQDKQDWAKNYLIESGATKLDFIGSMNLEDKPKSVAEKIIQRLKLPASTSYNFSQRKGFLNALKNCLEDHNIFVSITGSYGSKPITIQQAQGFAVCDSVAPYIFVNTNNSDNAKIFTLLHELVHLFLNETGISDEVVKYRKPECYEDKVELFCNAVAAEILMPEEKFLDFWSEQNSTLENKITKASQKFLVSELAVCVRIWKLGLISDEEFKKTFADIKTKIQEWFDQQKESKKKNSGGGDYYASMRARNGQLLSKLAFNAYRSGEIMPTEVYGLLKIKMNNFDKYFEKI